MNGRPDFIIIGAMKCATSTLHDQLAEQTGVFMTNPKEPCFFSDDAQWKRGVEWYRGLYQNAKPGDLCGESSTHYTKLPTYPKTIERMKQVCGDDVKFIYMMRHPIDRLVSHYIHEWSQGVIDQGVSIDEAIDLHPEMVDYGRYAFQLKPYVESFAGGPDRIHLIFFERFVSQPENELRRVARFLDLPGDVKWVEDLSQRNASTERVRKHAVRDAILATPGVRPMLRRVVPQSMRDRMKVKWSMQDRPELSEPVKSRLEDIFDDDLRELGSWIGVNLNCSNFKDVVQQVVPHWTRHTAGVSL